MQQYSPSDVRCDILNEPSLPYVEAASQPRSTGDNELQGRPEEWTRDASLTARYSGPPVRQVNNQVNAGGVTVT